MITVCVNILDNIDLLPYFLDYYTGLGADRFLLSVTMGSANPNWQKIVAGGYKQKIFLMNGYWGPDIKGGTENDALNKNRRHFNNGWHVICDLDEFHFFNGKKLPEVIAELEAHQVKATIHTWTDRHGTDLKFVPLQPGKSLDDTFCLKSNFSQIAMPESTSKIGLLRHDCDATAGHHNCNDSAMMIGAFTTHHFKWTLGVAERIDDRIKDYKRRMVYYLHEYIEQKRRIIPVHDGLGLDPNMPGLVVQESERIGI